MRLSVLIGVSGRVWLRHQPQDRRTTEITDDIVNLNSILEKPPDADVLREMIGFAAERLMNLEVGALTGAAPSEKSPLRLAQRNGYAH